MNVAFGRGASPETLGHQAALDAGAAAAELGASELALSYFERAAALRPTRYALAQTGSCLRDLGRLAEAIDAYRASLAASGGSPKFARVGLAAVLCDAARFEEALEVAQLALQDDPENPAALQITARCIEEQAEVLANSSVAPRFIAEVRAHAEILRARARSANPEDPADRIKRRRERAFPIHSLSALREPTEVPVEQLAIRASLADRPQVADLALARSSGERAAGPMRRWLRRLFAR